MSKNLTLNQNREDCQRGVGDDNFGIPESVFWILVSIATIVGNTASIYKLLRSKRRRANHNIYLVSLLASDLLMGLTMHPIAAISANAKSKETSCRTIELVRRFVYCNMFISLLSSLAIAVNRYKALKARNARSLNRMQAKNATKSKTPFIVVAAIWIFTIFTAVLLILANGKLVKLLILVPLLLFTVVIVYIIVAFKLKAVFSKVNPAFLKRSSEYKTHLFSLRLIQLILLMMLMTSLPAIIVRSIETRWHVKPLLVSLANKVYLLGPMLDPLGYVFVKCTSNLRRK